MRKIKVNGIIAIILVSTILILELTNFIIKSVAIDNSDSSISYGEIDNSKNEDIYTMEYYKHYGNNSIQGLNYLERTIFGYLSINDKDKVIYYPKVIDNSYYLYKYNIDNGSEELVFEGYINSMVINENSIFGVYNLISSSQLDRIIKLNLEDNSYKHIMGTNGITERFSTIIIEGQYLYYTKDKTSEIYKLDLISGNKEQIFTDDTLYYPILLKIKDGNMYYMNDNSLYVLNLDTKKNNLISQINISPGVDILLMENCYYTIDRGRIILFDYNTNKTDIIYKGNVSALNGDGNSIYFIDNDILYEMNLETNIINELTKVISNCDIFISDEYIVVSNKIDGIIYINRRN